MAHLSLFPGNHEIVEIEELNPSEHYRGNNHMKPELKREEKDGRSLASTAGYINSLEEDLNQLFEIYSRRASSSGRANSKQTGSSSRKNASKRPVKEAGSYSPKSGNAERVNLKQALRGLCLSQASEMAAMKRSAKIAGSSSEVGKITTLYHSVVVENGIPEHSQDEGRGSMLEISLVPEEITFDSCQKIPENLTSSNLWPSNQSSLVEIGIVPTPKQNERFFDSKTCDSQILKPEKSISVVPSSPLHVDDNMADKDHNILHRNRITVSSAEAGNGASPTEMKQKQNRTLQPSSCPPTAKNNTREITKSNVTQNGNCLPSAEFATQTLTDSLQKEKCVSPSTSCSSYCKTSVEPARKMTSQKDKLSTSAGSGTQVTKAEILHREENGRSPCHPDICDKIWVHNKSSMLETGKLAVSEEFASKKISTDSLPKDRLASLNSSRPSDGKSFLELARRMPGQTEITQLPIETCNKTKFEMLHKDEQASSCSPRRSVLSNRASNLSMNSPCNKLRSKPVEGKLDKVGTNELGLREIDDNISKTGSANGKKVIKSKKDAHHFVKPLIKTKNFVKRKSKKKPTSGNGMNNKRSEFNNDLYSSPNPIVCPRCQCVVTDAWKEVNQESPVSQQESPLSAQESLLYHHDSPVSYQDSPVSPFASLSAEVTSGNFISDVSTPGLSSESSNKSKTIVAEAKGTTKARGKGEFTQSLNDSSGGCSTSTSEENNLSRPSFCDRPHKSKDVRWEAIRCLRFQQGTIGLRHFNLLKKLGCGDIGTVYLAELIGTHCLFAIKVMDNEFLVRRKKIVRAQTEKEILRMLDHPFLPTLYCQFTSDNLSCLVMEFCPGGVRQRQPGRCFTEQASRFYVAEVLLALEYLHMLGIVYRDLKPENILVREDGHIMLSDFDLSLRCAVSPTLLVSASMSGPRVSKKMSRSRVDSRCVQPFCIEPSCQVPCFTPRLLATSSKLRKQKSDLATEMRPLLQLVAEPTSARSNSFVGTHEYLAPEIIKGEGHGSAVDWWTFGIFLYELLYGRTPFKGAGNDDTLANVVLQTLKFPDSPLVSLQARDLMASLLVKEPENRLGTERGAAEIKQHPFFDGLNWALIRCTVPPELPEQKSYGTSKTGSHENNKYVDYNSDSGEHLEFEVF